MEARFFEEFLESSFSIAVAAFLLFRVEERLDGLTDAVSRLGASADTLVRHIVRPAGSKTGAADDAA